MKKLAMIIIFLLVAAGAMAATEPGTEGGQDVQEENVQPLPVIETEVIEKSSKDANWPRPFIPSEKIGADSVVSFPADI